MWLPWHPGFMPGTTANDYIVRDISNLIRWSQALPIKALLWIADAIDDNTDMTDTSTWPDPPTDGPCQEGEPSRSKPRKRGEKSVYDDKGGEWRPHKPDKYHPEGHWNHKPQGKSQPWIDVDHSGKVITK